MHASEAFVNGAAGRRRPGADRTPIDSLALLNTLLVSSNARIDLATLERRKTKDEQQAEEEGKADTVSKPGGFANDPDDPTNPDEVRERHLNKLKP
jgi:hypothetical protein